MFGLRDTPREAMAKLDAFIRQVCAPEHHGTLRWRIVTKPQGAFEVAQAGIDRRAGRYRPRRRVRIGHVWPSTGCDLLIENAADLMVLADALETAGKPQNAKRVRAAAKRFGAPRKRNEP